MPQISILNVFCIRCKFTAWGNHYNSNIVVLRCGTKYKRNRFYISWIRRIGLVVRWNNFTVTKQICINTNTAEIHILTSKKTHNHFRRKIKTFSLFGCLNVFHNRMIHEGKHEVVRYKLFTYYTHIHNNETPSQDGTWKSIYQNEEVYISKLWFSSGLRRIILVTTVN